MRPVPAHKRTALRAIGAGVLLAISIGLSGCFALYGEGEGGPPEAFCGLLYACGNHGGNDDNDPPPDPSPPSNSGSSGGSAPTTEGETPTGGG